MALRRELAATAIPVHEARSIAECRDMLPRYPASFLVAELTPNSIDPLLARVAILEQDFPLARFAVVAERELSAYQWVMRQAGAIHFVVSTRDLAPLARGICRHLQRGPAPEPSPAERIWAELPWGRGEV